MIAQLRWPPEIVKYSILRCNFGYFLCFKYYTAGTLTTFKKCQESARPGPRPSLSLGLHHTQTWRLSLQQVVAPWAWPCRAPGPQASSLLQVWLQKGAPVILFQVRIPVSPSKGVREWFVHLIRMTPGTPLYGGVGSSMLLRRAMSEFLTLPQNFFDGFLLLFLKLKLKPPSFWALNPLLPNSSLLKTSPRYSLKPAASMTKLGMNWVYTWIL